MIRNCLYMRIACAVLAAGVYDASAAGKTEINVVRTNLVDRWITNSVEVRMPANHFVNEYRTNWVPLYRTNQVNLYRTNVVTLQKTNVLDVYRTNLVTWRVTNTVPVQVFETNLVTSYRTNWKALTLTNWETVLVFKTNWVHQPMTNLVHVDVQDQPPSLAEVPQASPLRSEASVQPAAPWPSVNSSEPLQIDATKIGAVVNSRAQVQMKVRPTLAKSPAVQVQQWRVESEDGRILSFAQEQEFKRELPLGRYKVEVKTKGPGARTVVTTRATLTVTAAAATVEPRRLALN